ncbi:lactate utilization protein C [Photobacterium frigidiphilum]|uniref:Lactate utilization protein C n=1 Tax=Photobacterium frigidiphilum TaxID=264736 RepID=A0A2T3J8B2_9GAMM|nr:lactate utilization protein C [Photobacterium frigidiphilum]PSU45028.1 lactate utilization protein C [Photobacterium frigidiphilum]
MSTSRNAILSRLRDAKPEAKAMETITYQPWVSNDAQLTRQRFIDGLSASHAEIISTDRDALNNVIKNIVVSKQFSRIALGTAGEFHSDIVQAIQSLATGSLETPAIETMTFDCDISDLKSALFNDVDAGITHCRAGIADTGTLMLWPDISEPRTLSLVPPCHIALIKRSTIVSNFAELMVTQAWQNNMPTNIVLVSGPSKTADIQQTLAYGAHGPSQLVVILIEDM